MMKNPGKWLTAAFLLLLLAAGCMTEAARNVENSKQLRVGMTKEQVLSVMGKPVQEEFSTPDLWYYFVESVWTDGLTTEEECMPLVFENGRLMGWGNRFYSHWRSREVQAKGGVE